MADNYINLPGSGAVSWKHSVATLSDLPASGNTTGDARVTRDTAAIYVWNGSAWVSAGGGGGSGTVTSVGLAAPGIFNVSGSPVTTAGTLTLTLATESANRVFAGPVSGGAATPTFRALVAADISALTGNLTDAGTDGITVTGGTGAVFGSGTSFAQHVSDSTHNGYLSSTDWSTFNSKQAAGNYITALTGDVTASGPGSAAATVAKIQGTTVSGTTGSGNVVFSSSPTLTTPNIGSATGSITGHAALDLALTGGTMSGVIDMGSNKITSVTDPTTGQDAATKNYVDAAVSALTPQQSVYAASTANIVGTYSNGASGVGATFTVTATGAFSTDGVSPPANSRILLKDQTSGLQNGIYNLTTVGTTGVSPILTRSTTYDSPSEMNGGGLIPVLNGTVNALSSWQQIATITTVGTDALVFSEFTANPSLYLLKTNNLSDVSSAATSFSNISPMTTLGDTIYGGSAGAGTRLAGNTTATKKFLTQTGNGSISAAPGWNTIASADLPAITLTGDVTGAASGGSVTTTVAKIAGTTVSGTTGSGNVVFSASPTLTGTITAAAANFSGAITASNLSGTNTGDVTIGTANGLSLAGQVLSLALSSTSTTGALSSTDWNTFNNKQATLTTGNLTDAGVDGIVVTGGTGAVIGSGTSLAQHVADTTHNGYLSSTDWNTFNGKQAAGNYITALTGDATASGPGSAALTLATVNSNVGSFTNASITVNAKGLVTAASSGTAPVTSLTVATANGFAGSFTASTTPVLTLTTSVTGLLIGNGTAISAQAVTNLTDAGTDGITITNGTGAVLGASPVTLSQHVADTTHNGYLSSTDWSTFNNKQATITTGNLTDAGTDGITVTGGTGAVIGSGTSLSQHVADTTHNGYLSSTDWNTFNGKQASGNYITALTGDVTASGPGSAAATVAKIQGTTVSGTTGTTNVVFSSSPTMTAPTALTSITSPLHIGGTTTTSPLALRSTSGAGTTGADIIFQTGNNGASEAMRILNSGFVGIGTASPTRRLTVVASAIGDGMLIVGNPSGTLSPQIAFSDGTNEEAAFGLALSSAAYSSIALVNDFVLRTDSAPSNGNLILSNQNNTSIKFATGTAPNTDTLKMILTAAGNLGIGTASPGSLLDVKGTIRLSGATSGFVGLTPAAAAGGTTYTLPSADGTSGQALTTNGSGTLSWSAGVGSVDYPTQATIWQNESTISVGTAFIANLGGALYFPEFYQSTPANGNAFDNVFFLKAGTYTLNVMGSTNGDRGILDWAVDGSTVLSGMDWYGGAAQNVVKTGSITIATSGNHTIKGTVNGKNGSSSNYYIAIEKFWIR